MRHRGVSFHEFELTIKPVRELRIKSSLNGTHLESRLWRFLKWRFSIERRYASLLRRIVPELHKGFLESFLYLIIERD